jgi:hypothetical protein
MMLKKASLTGSSDYLWEAKFAVFHALIEPRPPGSYKLTIDDAQTLELP